MFCPEVDYTKRYGDKSWVVITGGSSGQGRQFALEFAARGFNLLLVGSKRSFDVKIEVEAAFAGIEARVVLKDFVHAWEADFFDEVEEALDAIAPGAISFLVNNIGHRVAWAPHDTMPRELIHNTIACGTITHAMMTRICLPYLLDRPDGLRSGLISITAQVVHPNFGIGIALQNDLYLPYLAPYEAANAFGFFYSNSLYREYVRNPKNNIDMLVITPGAIGAVPDYEFVSNIMRLNGNVHGVWSGSWKQGLSLWLIGLMPPMKDYILHSTGKKIVTALMQRRQESKRVVE